MASNTSANPAVKVQPLTPGIGAELSGLDLSAPLAEAGVRAIQEAFYRYKVIFFRDAWISQRRMVELAELFGGAEFQDTFADGNRSTTSDDHPAVMRLIHDSDHGRMLDNSWHSDSMFWPEPPRGAMLHCVELPAVGGDTLWADMEAAYESLDTDFKQRLRPLVAVHDVAISARQTYQGQPELLAQAIAKFPPVRHPLVRRHPVTGRLSLYACEPNTSHVEGMSRAESDDLLKRLFALARVPEFQCRFRWSPGTLAVWDNRCSQHYAVWDYAPQRRVMERVMLKREKPA